MVSWSRSRQEPLIFQLLLPSPPIPAGIHVLRIVKYDRQTLAMRRVQSETVDTDPIVWTNQRFIRWVRSIDLGEYADNLKGE